MNNLSVLLTGVLRNKRHFDANNNELPSTPHVLANDDVHG